MRIDGTYFGDRRTAQEKLNDNIKKAQEHVDSVEPIKVELVFDLKSAPLVIPMEFKGEVLPGKMRGYDDTSAYALTPEKSIKKFLDEMVKTQWVKLPGRYIRSNRFVELRLPEGADDVEMPWVMNDDDDRY